MVIDLYEENIPYNNGNNEKPEVVSYLTPTWYKLPVVIILPGGGYSIHAMHEAEPIAEFYNNKGFHSFVLRYRLLPNLYPAALCDVQALIKYIRANSETLRVDPDRIFVVGFSAGGHLAALSAVSEDICNTSGVIDGFDYKPSGVILGYPVVNTGHACVKDICNNDEKLCEKLCIDRQITSDTPPMFIWHTSDDKEVDVSHSLMLASSLRRNNIKFEMHIFPSGEHGLALATLKKDISMWAQLSVDWIMREFNI